MNKSYFDETKEYTVGERYILTVPEEIVHAIIIPNGKAMVVAKRDVNSGEMKELPEESWYEIKIPK